MWEQIRFDGMGQKRREVWDAVHEALRGDQIRGRGQCEIIHWLWSEEEREEMMKKEVVGKGMWRWMKRAAIKRKVEER